MAVLFLFVLRVFLWFGFEEAKGKARVFRGDRNFELRDVVPVSASEELECLSVSSVADTMRFFRGVQDKDYGESGGLKTVNVRSMGSPYVEVFLRRGNMGMKVF